MAGGGEVIKQRKRMRPVCSHCRVRVSDRVCGQCLVLGYCSERCAAADWPIHCEAEPHCSDAESGQPDQVWPGLWLGGVEALQCLDALHIESVLTVVQQGRVDHDWLLQRVGASRHHLWLPHADVPSEDMSVDFARATQWIADELAAGRKVLVHCHAGISRSATMVAAYLLRFHTTRFPNVAVVLVWLRSKRPVVNPNSGFLKQLEGWQQHG